VQVLTPIGQCTSNFVFTDGAAVYLGQAAHCTTTGSPVSTGNDAAVNGCKAGSLPLGTEISVQGAHHSGVLAYNSWLAMQAFHEADPATCVNNDFAVIRLDPEDAALVNPTVPYWGGPSGLADHTDAGELVYSYGNSAIWLGIEPLQHKVGVSLGTPAAGWNQNVYTATPGIPGDSGSGFLDATGAALGVLSSLKLVPGPPLGNGVGMLARELAYARTHGLAGLELALGTEPFVGIP
jgi:hypothetical protein